MQRHTAGPRLRRAATVLSTAAATAGTMPGAAVLTAPTALAGAVLLAPAAQAAQYTVDACQHADGMVAPIDGWTGNAVGSPFTYFNNGCATGTGLDVSFDAGQPHDYGTQASWSVSAPAGTTLARLTGKRFSQLGPDQPYGSPGAVIYTNLGVVAACGPAGGCTGESGDVVYPLSDATTLVASVQCGGSPGGVCAPGNSALSLRQIALTLNDAESPRFTAPPSGPMTSSTASGRFRVLNYSAADTGSGLFVQRLFADGSKEIAGSVIDRNDGRCATYAATNHFSYRVPCKLSASGTMNVDTAALSDGQHEAALQISDAAGNTAVHGPWPILVDNQPPTVSVPTLSGSAAVGQTLTCTATVSGQSPATTYKWFRSASDGSDETQIVGATASTYTLTTAETGRKVFCHVTGSDGGGSATARTTLTTPPFNGGATVTGPVGGPAGTPGSSAPITGSAPAGPAAANGTNAGPAARVTAVWLKSGRTTLSDKFNGAPSLRGKVVNAETGEPISGAILDVTATPTFPGAKPLTKTGVRTTNQGTFTLKLPLGISSRTLQIVYRPSLDSPEEGGKAVLNLVVRAGVALTQVTARTRRLVLSGRLAGGPFPKIGPIVEVQVKKGRAWQVFASARANQGGRFTVTYRPAGPLPRGVVFTFRARLRADGKYPYAAGVSKPKRALVR